MYIYVYIHMMGHNLRLRLMEYERDVHCATLSDSSSSKRSTFTPCRESSNATSSPGTGARNGHGGKHSTMIVNESTVTDGSPLFPP